MNIKCDVIVDAYAHHVKRVKKWSLFQKGMMNMKSEVVVVA